MAHGFHKVTHIPSQYISVDETMFLFKGLADGKRRRIVGKPISTGLKLWIVVDENEMSLFWWLDGSVNEDFSMDDAPSNAGYGEIVMKMVNKMKEHYPSMFDKTEIYSTAIPFVVFADALYGNEVTADWLHENGIKFVISSSQPHDLFKGSKFINKILILIGFLNKGLAKDQDKWLTKSGILASLTCSLISVLQIESKIQRREFFLMLFGCTDNIMVTLINWTVPFKDTYFHTEQRNIPPGTGKDSFKLEL